MFPTTFFLSLGAHVVSKITFNSMVLLLYLDWCLSNGFTHQNDLVFVIASNKATKKDFFENFHKLTRIFFLNTDKKFFFAHLIMNSLRFDRKTNSQKTIQFVLKCR